MRKKDEDWALFWCSLLEPMIFGEVTEEETRVEAQAEIRRVIDNVIDSIKRNVSDEETRDRIRRDLLQALPEETDLGPGDAEDQSPH